MHSQSQHAVEVKERGRISKAREYLRDEGFRSFCGLAFRAVTDPLASTKVVYDLTLQCRHGVPVTAAAGETHLTEVGEAEVPLLDTLMNQPVAVIRARLAQGERAFVALAGSSPSAVIWVAAGPRSQVVPGMDLAPGQAYLFGLRVLPRMRGKGLAAYMDSAVSSRLAGEGFSEMLARIEETNAPALRAATKVGFTITAAIRYRRRLGRVSIEQLPMPDALPVGPNRKSKH